MTLPSPRRLAEVAGGHVLDDPSPGERALLAVFVSRVAPRHPRVVARREGDDRRSDPRWSATPGPSTTICCPASARCAGSICAPGTFRRGWPASAPPDAGPSLSTEPPAPCGPHSTPLYAPATWPTTPPPTPYPPSPPRQSGRCWTLAQAAAFLLHNATAYADQLTDLFELMIPGCAAAKHSACTGTTSTWPSCACRKLHPRRSAQPRRDRSQSGMIAAQACPHRLPRRDPDLRSTTVTVDDRPREGRRDEALRHQLGLLQRQLDGKRPRFHAADRAFLGALLTPLPPAALGRLRLLALRVPTSHPARSRAWRSRSSPAGRTLGGSGDEGTGQVDREGCSRGCCARASAPGSGSVRPGALARVFAPTPAVFGYVVPEHWSPPHETWGRARAGGSRAVSVRV